MYTIQVLRKKRSDLRTAELVRQDKEADKLMQATLAIENLKNVDTVVKGKYSIWRRDFENPNSDSTLKLMRDQIIMAKVYANIAKSKNQSVLYNSLLKHVRENLHVIGEANSDAELHPRYHYFMSTVMVIWYMYYWISWKSLLFYFQFT